MSNSESSSSSKSSAVDEVTPGTAWIYVLKKSEVIEQLVQEGEDVTPNETLDALRRKLVTLHKAKVKSFQRFRREPTAILTVERSENQGTGPEETARGTSQQRISIEMEEARVRQWEFNVNKDDWESYTERLEMYFVANDVPADKQAATLLTKVGAETYKLIRNLCSPAKPSSRTYGALVKLVADHLCPKPSEAMERCKFHQARQTVTETVGDYVARLKALSLHCNFTDIDVRLRDQLVCGLRDHDTKTELFREEALTFDKAYKIAISQEKAAENASKLEKIGSTSEKEAVNAMSSMRNQSATKPGNRRRSTGAPRRNYDQRNKDGKKTTQSQSGARPEGGQCYCCGKPNHFARECKWRFKSCSICHRRGHLETVCRSKQGAKQQLNLHTEEAAEGGLDEEEDDFLLMEAVTKGLTEEVNGQVNYTRSYQARADPMYLNVTINNVNVCMQVDTGAYVAVMAEKEKSKYFPGMATQPADIVLKAYGNIPLRPIGMLRDVCVRYSGKVAILDLYIMPGVGPTLLGRCWLAALNKWPLLEDAALGNPNLDECQSLDTRKVDKLTEEFVQKYPRLFGPGTGLYNGDTLKLKLKEGATPVALKARHIPFALREGVEKEIDRLLKLKHLEKVEVSEWATPIVPVIKSNGSVRICGNFKLTVNPWLVIDRYPIPLINEIFAALGGGDRFSQVDLSHAYMQIPVDESSRELLTIITHKGLFRYTKLTEGVASGPGDFQRKIETTLHGIPNTQAYLDNIYCTGKSVEEHLQTLHKVFERLESRGFKVNVDKCEFFKERLDVLGFTIDKVGLHKSPEKVRAMVTAPTPKNAKQLSSILGLITYYERFLPERADRLKPIYNAVKREKFAWSRDCQEAFEWLKKELVKPTVLAHYNPEEELILACDASSYGLSAILSHKYQDGSERPIAYGSKIIPDKELSRATIDKEAGAIIFGFKKFYNYVYGREIILRTDHKPLIYIFGPGQEIPLTVASRLQRWAYFLSRFTYKIEYIRSEQNGNCDALSRLPVEDNTPVFGEDFTSINYVEEGLEALNASALAIETKKDRVLCNVIRYIMSIWPNEKLMAEEEKTYSKKKHELSVERGCILWGYRAVIPRALRPRVLQELHASHFGIVKMKMIARSYVWWPDIDRDLEEISSSCTVCVESRKKPARISSTPWPWPEKFWTRVHSDFLGPFYDRMFLLVLDAHAKWPEVFDMGNNTQATRVIAKFKELFARFGFPIHLVTDNGTQYTSGEFQKYVNRCGIRHSFSPPYHPATNGAAENFVGVFKDKVKKIVSSGKTLEHAVNLFLFDYRSTEHCTTGRSPAWLVYKKEMRTRFDLLRPEAAGMVEAKQLRRIIECKPIRDISFDEGDSVMVDNYQGNKKGRIKAKIVCKLSPVTYKVEMAPNVFKKKHVDQIVRYHTPQQNLAQPKIANEDNTDKNEPRRSARLAEKRSEQK